MPTHKLMIKTHNDTGLRYLCYTRSSGKTYDEYLGSGTRWISHLKLHGNNINTKLIFESELFEEFKQAAIYFSNEFDVVKSEDWANLKIEEGDGGDTVSKKYWITNGSLDKYLDIGTPIPEGWKRGRSNCVFNDPERQKQFNKLTSPEQKRISMKKAWASGAFDKRDNSKCGRSGELNPTKRPEVKQKISEARLGYKYTRVDCQHCGKSDIGINVFTRRHKDGKCQTQ